MKYSMLTDKGAVRSMNQDSCFLTLFDDTTCFAVVCDGMGGLNAGEIAADIAIKNISERFAAGWRKGMSVDSIKNLLLTSISAANICVFDEAKTDDKLSGMGTTAVAAVYFNNTLITAHIGDSRAYYCDDELIQITKDHSLVQEMLDSGKLSPEDAKIYPYKNVITRAIGIEESIDIEFNVRLLNKNDKVLLCSDGLTNFVTDNVILSILKSVDTENCAKFLIDKANENGGGDNVTAVVFSHN